MINTSKDTIANLLKENYDQLLSNLSGMGTGEIIAKYFGGVSQEFIHGFTENVEQVLLESGEKKAMVKKTFAVLIEGLQNIYNHGACSESEGKIGACVLITTESSIDVHFMNLISTENIPKLKTFLDRLNGLNRLEMKDLYMETLSNGLLSEKGGAGLGYMTMRLKSGNLIDYKFTDPTDDQCGFHFKVNILRKTEK